MDLIHDILFCFRPSYSFTRVVWWHALSLVVTTLCPGIIIMLGMVILSQFSFLFQHFLLLNLLTEYLACEAVILTSTVELSFQSCLLASTWCTGWSISVSRVIFHKILFHYHKMVVCVWNMKQEMMSPSRHGKYSLSCLIVNIKSGQRERC